jgi:hypothetical protein
VEWSGLEASVEWSGLEASVEWSGLEASVEWTGSQCGVDWKPVWSGLEASVECAEEKDDMGELEKVEHQAGCSFPVEIYNRLHGGHLGLLESPLQTRVWCLVSTFFLFHPQKNQC